MRPTSRHPPPVYLRLLLWPADDLRSGTVLRFERRLALTIAALQLSRFLFSHSGSGRSIGTLKGIWAAGVFVLACFSAGSLICSMENVKMKSHTRMCHNALLNRRVLYRINGGRTFATLPRHGSFLRFGHCCDSSISKKENAIIQPRNCLPAVCLVPATQNADFSG